VTIEEFEAQVKAIIPKDKDCPGLFVSRKLTIGLCLDGCLSAGYEGKGIPCEGRSWAEALDIIVEHIREVENQEEL